MDTQQTYQKIASFYAEANQERSKILATMAQFARILPPQSIVLDVGCGPAYDTQLLRQRFGLKAIGCDLSLAMMQAGNSVVPLAQADMQQLPFADGACAGLWVCASLLHLPKTAVPAILTRFFNLLTPNGYLQLMVKEGKGEMWVSNAYGQQNADRFFSYWQMEPLLAHLTNAGFNITHQQINQSTPHNWLSVRCQKPPTVSDKGR